MTAFSSLRKAAYVSSFYFGKVALKHRYARAIFFRIAHELSLLMPLLLDDYRTGDISLKLAGNVPVSYDLDGHTAIALGHQTDSQERIDFLRQSKSLAVSSDNQGTDLTQKIIERNSGFLSRSIGGYPSPLERSYPYLEKIGFSKPATRESWMFGPREATIKYALESLSPVIARCIELGEDENFFWHFANYASNTRLDLRMYSEFWWSLKESLESIDPQSKNEFLHAMWSTYHKFRVGSNSSHVRETMATIAELDKTIPEIGRKVWYHYGASLKSNLFENKFLDNKGIPEITLAEIEAATEDFKRVFGIKRIEWKGKTYAVNELLPLDTQGKADIMKVMTQSTDGENKIFLIKRGEMSVEQDILRLAAILDLETYGLQEAPVAGWWLIEFLDNDPIAFKAEEYREDDQIGNTKWRIKTDLNSLSKNNALLESLGEIMALEYLFIILDSKMKHILKLKDRDRFFRIDYEFLFGENRNFLKTNIKSNEVEFLDLVRQKVGNLEWLGPLRAGFIRVCEKAKKERETLLQITRQHATSANQLEIERRIDGSPQAVLEEVLSPLD